MNKEDLRALLSIAKKQGWNGKPAAEFITVTLQFSEDMGINLSDIEGLLATEELLDTLNSEYDWVDAFDPRINGERVLIKSK